jgi:hypothetical protein
MPKDKMPVGSLHSYFLDYHFSISTPFLNDVAG